MGTVKENQQGLVNHLGARKREPEVAIGWSGYQKPEKTQSCKGGPLEQTCSRPLLSMCTWGTGGTNILTSPFCHSPDLLLVSPTVQTQHETKEESIQFF